MKNENLPSGKWLAFGIAVAVAAALAAMAYTYWYGICDQEKCGQFGDFLGGVLNPVIGAVTLGALAWTVKTQNETLRLTRQALLLAESEARQRAEESAKTEKAHQDERDKAKALDTFEMTLRRTEDLLDRPVLPWDAPEKERRFSILQALDGAAPEGCLLWWRSYAVGSRDERAKLYAARISQQVGTLTLAAVAARPFLSSVYWLEIRSRLKLLLSLVDELQLAPREEVLLLANELGIEDLVLSRR